VVQQQSPASEFSLPDRPAAYESIDVNWINPSVITSGTIHFSVLSSWLTDENIKPENVVLMRSHDNVWTELPTAFESKNGDNYNYNSDTPGFSYFAVSERVIPPKPVVTPQVTLSESGEGQPVTPSVVEVVPPSVTVTAITTPIQTESVLKVVSGTPAPSIIPAPVSVLLTFGVSLIRESVPIASGIILICVVGAMYFFFRKIQQKTQHKTSILIVDDEPQVREVFSLTLAMEGNAPSEASSGEECLSLLKNKKNHPDVILLDVNMSPMDGWETLKKIKKDPALRKIPVVMLTGKQLLPEEAKQYGICIDDYLLKPIMPYDLNSAIEYVLNRKKTIENQIQMATKAGHGKDLVCEYAKLAKRVDVEKKLLGLISTTYIKGRETEQETLRTIEDLADGIQMREENLIKLQQKIFLSPNLSNKFQSAVLVVNHISENRRKK